MVLRGTTVRFVYRKRTSVCRKYLPPAPSRAPPHRKPPCIIAMLFLLWQATWAKLYYRSCTSLDGLLGEKEGGACPVRVMGVSGKWFWEGAREAFIR